MKRLVAVIATAAAAAYAPPVEATPLCEHVDVNTLRIGGCLPYPAAVYCVTQFVTHSPSPVLVSVTVCVPVVIDPPPPKS